MTDRNLEEAIFQLQKLNTENGVKQLVEEAAQLYAGGRHIEAGALMEKAEAIYRGLIEDHPADPTLRVNLGLVFLKLGAANDAARCFETTLDLSPDHRKAQNYLGLALAHAFWDRLRGKKFGVTAWIKFPLRLLSMQQLERVVGLTAFADMVR